MADDHDRWRETLRQKRLANAKRWVELIEESDNQVELIAADYDNLLRALETALASRDMFPLAYRLIQAIYSFSFDYGDWDRWLAYLEEALDMSRSLDHRPEQARLLEQMADLRRYKGDFDQAEANYQEATSLHKTLPYSTLYPGVLAKLASLYELRGRYQEGLTLCREALAIAESRDDERAVAYVNMSLSQLHAQAEQWSLALVAVEKAYESWQKLGEWKFAAQAALSMIGWMTWLERWDEAKKLAQEALGKLAADKDIRTMIGLKINLGVIAFQQDIYPEAEAYWQESLRLNSQTGEPETRLILCNNLGMVYIKMQEWEVAEQMLSQAVAGYESMGNVYQWANSLDNLADLYEARGETAVCRQILEQAGTGLRAKNDSPPCQELLARIERRLAEMTGAPP